MFDWRVLPAAIRRIDLGGKALTNFMKELVSYRQVRNDLRGAMCATQCGALSSGQPWVLVAEPLTGCACAHRIVCRSVNMMDETYLLEHIKEQLCFVSQDTAADLRAARFRTSPFR